MQAAHATVPIDASFLLNRPESAIGIYYVSPAGLASVPVCLVPGMVLPQHPCHYMYGVAESLVFSLA